MPQSGKKEEQMKTLALTAIALGALVFCGCRPAATDDELKSMCTNLLTVRGEMNIPDDATAMAKIDADFQGREKHLVDWKARDMQHWDDELAARIAALPPEPKKKVKPKEGEVVVTRESLEAEYAKKKAIGAEQFDRDIAALAPAKEEAVKAMKEKLEVQRAAAQEQIDECLKQAKVEGVKQETARCRIAAKDVDTYWNKCR